MAPSPQAVLALGATLLGVADVVFILVTGDVGWGWILLVVAAAGVWSSSDAFHRRRRG